MAATGVHARMDLLLETGCFLCGPYHDVMKFEAMSSVAKSSIHEAVKKRVSCNSVAVKRKLYV
jgi:hypothetical protein